MKKMMVFTLTVIFVSTITLTTTSAQEYVHSATLSSHTRSVHSIAFVDDHTFISGGWDNTLRAWDLNTHRQRWGYDVGAPVSAVAIPMPNSFFVVYGGDRNHDLRTRNTDDGEFRASFEGHTNSVHDLAFKPRSYVLASGSIDGTIRIWNMRSERHVRTLRGHRSEIFSVAWSPNGRTLASASRDGTVRLWNPDNGANLSTLHGHGQTVWSVAFSPDGRTLASGGQDGTIHLWNPRTGNLITTLRGHTGGVHSIAFHPNGQLFVSGSHDHTIRLWNPRTGDLIATLRGHTSGVESVAFHPNGRTLISGSQDGTIRLWRASTVDIIDPSQIGIVFPDDLIQEEAFGTDAIYFILKAQHPILTGVSGVKYGSGKIFLDIPIDREIFIFPIPSKTKTEEARDAAKGVVVNLLIDLIPIRIPLSGTLQKVWDVFSKVQEAKEEQNYKLRIDLQNPDYDPERPEKEVKYIVLLRQKVGVRNPLSGINITMEQQYRSPSGTRVRSKTVEETKFWRFGEGWAAPAAHPVDISDYPPFQLLPPEVQQYLLLQFEEFTTIREWLIPDETAMNQNYPNPFNPETWIPYQLLEPAEVTVSIYSMDGKLVRTLVLGHQPAGVYQSKSRAAYWDGRNAFGERVASGLYFYTLAAGDFTATRKMLIRK